MFTIFNAEITVVGVLLAAVAAMVVGMLWYGPIFGKKWMQLTGKSMQDTQAEPMDYLYNAVAALVSAFVLNHIIFYAMVSSLFVELANAFSESMVGILSGSWSKWVVAIFVAVIVWAAFTVPAYLNEMVWEGRNRKLMMLNSAHQLVTFLVMALVLVAFMGEVSL